MNTESKRVLFDKKLVCGAVMSKLPYRFEYKKNGTREKKRYCPECDKLKQRKCNKCGKTFEPGCLVRFRCKTCNRYVLTTRDREGE